PCGTGAPDGAGVGMAEPVLGAGEETRLPPPVVAGTDGAGACNMARARATDGLDGATPDVPPRTGWGEGVRYGATGPGGAARVEVEVVGKVRRPGVPLARRRPRARGSGAV
ncbi:unnamed protein product, partial [Ectocarpus sp. 13 AM-2016]